MNTEGMLELKRNLLHLSMDNAMLALQLVRLSLIVLTLYFLRWPPFKRLTDELLEFRALAYIFLMVPLIFPHQQKYAFVFMLPAAVFIAYHLVARWNKKKGMFITSRYGTIGILFGLSFALTTLTTDGLIGRELNHITQHYKLITWGALLLIVPLILIKPVLKK